MGKYRLLVDEFESNRSNLRTMAFRILGSLNEAEDAVQECWLRLCRADTSDVEDLGKWLTTVVARICLDMLRSRKLRRENPLDVDVLQQIDNREDMVDPEYDALLADAVGLALLVVLEKLAPAERLAFVLHDLFAMPFDEIATVVGRTPTAARQLASRARRRIQGRPLDQDRQVALSYQRDVVEAFLAASRGGDIEALLAVLDPDVVVRADGASLPSGRPMEIRGAAAVVKQAVGFAERARYGQIALINGAVGVIVAPRGRLLLVGTFAMVGTKIVEMEVIADPDRLHQLDLAILEG